MSYKDLAIKAAKAAAKIHLKYFDKGVEIQSKGKEQDRVTVADIESEEKIAGIIKKECPDHNIIGEEGKYEKTSSPYTWIIDPLDGTNNFSQGLPIFCVSIALAKDDEIILGVIHDPTRNEMFLAQKGKGATLNGKKISVSSISSLGKSILITGFYYDRGQPMLDTLDNIKTFLLKGITGIRRLGSAALDLCYIASGRADGFWEFTLNPWDFAAGKLIVEEAGGRVSDKEGKEVNLKESYIVASNGLLHEEMLKVLNVAISEDALSKEWNNPEDERWNDV